MMIKLLTWPYHFLLLLLLFRYVDTWCVYVCPVYSYIFFFFRHIQYCSLLYTERGPRYQLSSLFTNWRHIKYTEWRKRERESRKGFKKVFFLSLCRNEVQKQNAKMLSTFSIHDKCTYRPNESRHILCTLVYDMLLMPFHNIIMNITTSVYSALGRSARV